MTQPSASVTARKTHGESDLVQPRNFPAWPHYDADEIEAVASVMRSGKVNYWTGDEGRRFESEYAVSVGRKHAVALANGTVALELALYALGIGEGDDVVTTPRTFIASASCAIMRGARPVFADVDPDSQNITAATIEKVLTPRTRAIIPVHLAGWPCDMAPIMELARARGIFVVEDCAQANGATIGGRPVGSFGDIAAFSFCQDKIITTLGEGGMIMTDNAEWWKKCWAFKDHGKNYDAVYKREHAPGFRWLHESFGTNWRMTEAQSAVGRIQVGKLESWVGKRRRNANILAEALSKISSLRVTEPGPAVHHSYYKCYVFIRPERLKPGWTRDRIMAAIVAEGVPCYSGSCGEIYLEKAFHAEMKPPARLPVAQKLGETSLMFLVHPTLGESEMRETGRAVQKVMADASQ